MVRYFVAGKELNIDIINTIKWKNGKTLAEIFGVKVDGEISLAIFQAQYDLVLGYLSGSITKKELAEIQFAFNVCKHVKSNAIVIAKDQKTIGIGAGQMNRVGAAKIALKAAGSLCSDAVLASDGFFPFADTVELANEYGIKAIIQPGGSLRDQESIDMCNSKGISMVFTQKRHFLH